MTESRWLWKYVNLPLSLAVAVAVLIHTYWAAGGFWVSLAATLLGSIVAVNYIDRAIARRDQLAWKDADSLVAKRLQFVAAGTITNVRVAVGLEARELQLSRVTDHAGFFQLCERDIEPAIDGLVRRLDQAHWKKLTNVLQIAYRDFQDLLQLFGSKLRPDEYSGILSLQDDIRGVLGMATTFPDMLGVPDDKLPPTRYGDQVEFKHHMTRQLASQVASIVATTRRLGTAFGERPAPAA